MVPGFWADDLPGFVVRKQTAMKAEDEARFRALAETHGVPFDGLLHGPFQAHLVRAPRFDALPERVELLCGLGMRPTESVGLEAPDGMTSWPVTEGWRIDATVLGEVTAPQIHAAIPIDEVVAGIEAARGAIRSAAVTAPWKRFAADAGWTDVDFEARLYLRAS